MSELAIASVKPQEWEQPYEISEAMNKGNLFPQLQKPFFVEDETELPKAMPKSDCEAKLLEIQQVSFALIDLTLFLDTHPNQSEAGQLKRELQEKRKQLMQEFAQKYYPLTMDCVGTCKDVIPWEGGCDHVEL